MGESRGSYLAELSLLAAVVGVARISGLLPSAWAIMCLRTKIVEHSGKDSPSNSNYFESDG